MYIAVPYIKLNKKKEYLPKEEITRQDYLYYRYDDFLLTYS